MITFSEIISALEDPKQLENIRLSLKGGENIFSLLDSDAQVSAFRLIESNPEKYRSVLLEQKSNPIQKLMSEIENRTQRND